MMTVVFATDTNNETVPAYELISPKINSNGDVMKEQHLLITLRVNQKVDGVLSLIRIDEPRVLVASPDMVRRLRILALQAPTQQTYSASEIGDSRLDPIVVITREDVLASETSREVMRDAYAKAGLELQSAHDLYQEAYAKARETISADRLNQMIFQRRLLENNLNGLHSARQNYEKTSLIYLQIRNRYESLFRVKVVDKAPITLQGALPIFNLTVRDILVGKYELIIEDAKTAQRIGDRVTFVVRDQKEAAVEIIERVREQLTDIWRTN
jgi:hypothetical protein